MQNINRRFLLIACMLLMQSNLVNAANEFTPDSQPTGWLSSPDVTFFNLSSGTEVFYHLGFFKDTWSGNVHAHDVNNIARVQSTGPWDELDPTLATAASLLEAANYSTGRKIATNGGAFRWASLSGAEQTALGTESVLNYVRGDRSNEEPDGESFRKRELVLGDILHSNLSYWDDGTNQTLYVGSNGGMLHAFNANTGAENWAYVPSMLISKLGLLKVKPYIHTHYVDGTISIANVEVSGASKTFLVGGLGAGGKGIYALDVTTATAADEAGVASKVMWEVTATGSFANLGNTYGTPQITRLSNGTAVVIFANGYMGASGEAILYIVNAVTGALIAAINTNSGSVASPNGLSSPTLYDTDGDGAPEFAYAGDLDGHVWKFDLIAHTASLLHTTSPLQAVTAAPAIRAHPLGGQIVAFATGRMLSSGDKFDTSVHYAYGIWDGAPDANDTMLAQTLTQSTFNSTTPVRTVSNNILDWTSGAGHDYGWKVALPAGERVVGERPFFNNGRFYFLTTNPTVPGQENWIHELVFNTGGSPLGTIFDLNEDGLYNSDDLADNAGIPVAKYLGPGIMSQPRLVEGVGITTTLYVFHPDQPVESGVPTPPPDPGVSGGHFDFDIFYYGDEAVTIEAFPTDLTDTATVCKKSKDIAKELDTISKKCVDHPDIADGYTYLSDYVVGSICKPNDNLDKVEYYIDITCNTVTTKEITSTDYKKIKHVHEYDDKYDVTGVNMLNASAPIFNLSGGITDDVTEFKILVMNQYLNPAVTLSVGGADYENVKTYGNLASQTSPETLLAGLSTYTMANINTFIYNLPLDAFKNKDWWDDGSERRAGLIPTQTGCVNKLDTNGVIETPGKQGERFNGSITFQLIKADTPAGHIEFNGPDVTYGWRVKQEFFKEHVLVEYLSFWHHPNKHCYHEADWVPDPPEDFEFSDKSVERAVGSADPTDGVFAEGLAIVDVTTTVDGNATTTVTTYSDGSQYIKIETTGNDGSTTIYQQFRDGTEETVVIYSGRGGAAGFIDPNTGSPEEDIATGSEGRQSWRDIKN